MENLYLSAVVDEIRESLASRMISRILVSGTGLIFELRPGDERALFVSLDRSEPALFLSSRATERAGKNRDETPFALQLKNRAAGAKLVSIAKPLADRIVEIEFEKFDVAGDRQRTRLSVALTGRSANAYLFNSDGRLVAAFDERGRLPKPPGSDRNAEAKGSRPDSEPPAQPDAQPDAQLDAQLDRVADSVSFDEAMRRYFGPQSVFGPLLRNEFVVRCRQATPAAALRSLYRDLLERPPQPAIYSKLPLAKSALRLINLKSDLILSHVPLEQAEGLERSTFGSLSEAADAYYALRDVQAGLRAEYESTRQLLRHAAKRLASALDRIRADRDRFENPDRLKRAGDLLLANLATARIDGPRAWVIDYYNPDQPEIEIAIPENKPLTIAASGYFSRYQKAQRALLAVEKREAEAEARLAPLRRLLEELEATSEAAGIQEIRVSAERLLGIRKGKAPGGQAPKKRAADQGRRFRTTDGYDVLVGRNDRENDELTFRVARSQDVWMHAADYPGSHVVIRNPNRGEVPQRAIKEAAEVAAFYSQARDLGKAAVHYTLRKNVSKPPRAKPGLVRLSAFKTILVEPGCNLEKLD